ncbi:MAG: malate dehydrogenase [Deltaproteobacteria bacterium]|jgi:malate dehydrogenase|nr:malate dehydrogenase [Deltaproteobacteria bacterium]
MRKKITVIGAGNVGATAAHCCLRRELGEIVLVDVTGNIPEGKALDLAQAAVLEGHAARVRGTADYADTAGSDIVIITAGVSRKPGMSRDDLLKTNLDIVTRVTAQAAEHSPEALFIIASNPVDVMCGAALQAGHVPCRRIVGLSGVLDAARMRAFIAGYAGVPLEAVQGMVIGEHGEFMVPLPRLASINGIPAPVLLTAGQLEDVRKSTVSGGAGIVSLLGYSAYYAPGMALATMVEALLNDSGNILPCSVYLENRYGARGIFMCVPARLNAQGVEEIIELELDEAEKTALDRSIANIGSNMAKAGLNPA